MFGYDMFYFFLNAEKLALNCKISELSCSENADMTCRRKDGAGSVFTAGQCS